MGQYIVKANGDIISQKEKAYPVAAPSKDEALEIAKRYFVEDFEIANNEIYLKASGRTVNAILALVALIIPILLSTIKWVEGHQIMSIQPTLVSCLDAVLIYSAFVVRFKGIKRTINSWIDISFCIVIPLILSAFIRTLFATQNLKILYKEISIDTSVILLIAILLSWLGLKLVSAACMLGIGIVSIGSLLTLSKAMGSIWGPVFIICSFVGFLLYLSIEPAIIEAIPSIMKAVKTSSGYLKNDFSEARKTVRDVGSKAGIKTNTPANNRLDDMDEE